MSHRDNFIKTNKEFSKPLDIFNIGFMGALGAPPDVPSAPTASVSTSTVTISWVAPDAHGNAIDVYNVYRNGSYLKQVSTTSTTDTTGTLGTSYVYAVDAHNVIGWSGVSANSNAVIPSTAPATPSAPSASTNNTNGQNTVTWSAPSANGTAITSYVLTINGSGSNVGNVTSYVHTNPTLGTAYVYTISAINATGTSSASSNSNSVTPATVPSTPATPSVSVSTSTISISWSAPSANGSAIDYYHLYRNNVYLKQVTGTSTTDTTGTLGTGYYYKVYAHNAIGWSSSSGNSATVVPSTVPNAPTIGTTTNNSASNGTLIVNWSAATNNGNAVTAYQIYANNALLTTVGNVTSYIHTIVLGNSYYYKVRATNANGYGAFSANSNTVATNSLLVAATGGTITTSGSYKIHSFTSNGTFNVTGGGTSPNNVVEYLVIGAGGDTNTYNTGGAGAGAYRTATGHVIAKQSYSITVGTGSSIFSTITSEKGGLAVNGNNDYLTLRNSATASGAAFYGHSVTNAGGTSGAYGNNAGNNNHTTLAYPAAGGGGAGGVGQNTVSSTKSGAGGAGLASSITGTSIIRAGGGGGGGSYYTTTSTTGGGAGGSGGGGAGNSDGVGQNGQANTGSGAGGGSGTASNGGQAASGGTGIVILRYKYI